MEKFNNNKITASWYDPRNGDTTTVGTFTNKGIQVFDPPGEKKEGNDWVLVLKKEV
jgi:hypothetical protein